MTYELDNDTMIRICSCWAVLASLPFSAACTPKKPGIPIYAYRVANVYPHRPEAFTQGLVFVDGFLYEGTGMHGRSTLCRIKLETGKVLDRRVLPRQYWGEGLTIFKNHIIQLTWKAHIGFVYQKGTLNFLHKLKYETEGWGITHDTQHLIMSDGSATLYFRDPNTFATVRTIQVTDEQGPVRDLNELEYVKGRIFANVWQTDRIAIIDPQTGRISVWIDLHDLAAKHPYADVLNGIAFDAQQDRLFITGKFWPALYEIELIP
jgi:glutamine cyclotransferase